MPNRLMMFERDGKFSITLENRKIISDIIRSFYLNIFIGTPFLWALAGLLRYRIELDGAPNTPLWIVLILFMILSSTLTIIAPTIAIRKHNKLVVELLIDSDKIHATLRNGNQLQINIIEVKRSSIEFTIAKTTYKAIYLTSLESNASCFLIPNLFEHQESLEIWFEKLGR